MPDNLAVHTMQDEIANRHKCAGSVDVLSAAVVTGVLGMHGNQIPPATAGRIAEFQAFPCQLPTFAIDGNHKVNDRLWSKKLSGACSPPM